MFLSAYTWLEGMQDTNVPVRDPEFLPGVQGPPKLSIEDKDVERGNPTSLPNAILGRHYRKACCWSGRTERLKEANAIGKAGG